MCLICERIEDLKNGDNPFLVKEFKYSYLVVGDHQFFQGYCQLIMKEHVEDLTDLDPVIQGEFFREVTRSAKVIKRLFKADRINYSCLGNVVQHVHFHIFPRYKDELAKNIKKDPWAHSDQFSSFETTDAVALDIVESLRPLLN